MYNLVCPHIDDHDGLLPEIEDIFTLQHVQTKVSTLLSCHTDNETIRNDLNLYSQRFVTLTL